MANNIIRILRSITAGSRPSSRTYGEPYVNLSDNQMGVFDSSNVARDLIGVPFFSSAASYGAGQGVNQGGQLYLARTAIVPATFNPAQWTPVVAQRDYAGGMVNKFRNAAFEYTQRTLPIVITSIGYAVDGWIVGSTGGSSTANTSANALSTLRSFSLQVGSGVTNSYLLQRIESTLAAAFGGVQVTCQFKVFPSAGAAVTPQLQVFHPTAPDNYSSVATDLGPINLQSCPASAWTTVAYTFNVPVASAINGLGVSLMFGAAAGRTFNITEPDIRVTPGYPTGLCANPPAVELRTGGSEAALNYRYYQAFSNPSLFSGDTTTGYTYYAVTHFPFIMRAVPMITTTDLGNAGFTAGLPTVSNITTAQFWGSKAAGAGTFGAYFYYGWTANAEI